MFDLIPLPSAWDIPVAAGVPALLGHSIGRGLSASASTALGGILQDWTTAQASRHWGIFDQTNKNVLTAARVLGVEYEASYTISDAPLEDGAFASYNKVKRPYSARVLFVCDGTENGSGALPGSRTSILKTGRSDAGQAVRTSFLNTLERIVQDTALYTVVTPEKTYLNANIVGYRWRREARQGVTMLIAEVALQEVRNTGTRMFRRTKTPDGACVVPIGTVQGSAADKSIQDQIKALPVVDVKASGL